MSHRVRKSLRQDFRPIQGEHSSGGAGGMPPIPVVPRKLSFTCPPTRSPAVLQGLTQEWALWQKPGSAVGLSSLWICRHLTSRAHIVHLYVMAVAPSSSSARLVGAHSRSNRHRKPTPAGIWGAPARSGLFVPLLGSQADQMGQCPLVGMELHTVGAPADLGQFLPQVTWSSLSQSSSTGHSAHMKSASPTHRV